MKNLKKYPLIHKTSRFLLPLALVGLCFYLLSFAFDQVAKLSVSSTNDRMEGLVTTSSANALFASAESLHLNSNLEGALPQQAMPLQTLFALDNQMKAQQLVNAQVTSNTDSIELNSTADWLSFDSDYTQSAAWGDVDNDGDLDLAVGNYGEKNKLYLNHDGRLETNASWQSEERDETRSVAWGDVDGDGDLDLAVGNYAVWDNNCKCNLGAPNKLYLNQGGQLEKSARWQSEDNHKSHSVAWADVNGDGQLDLAVGNWEGPIQIYMNLNQGQELLEKKASWQSKEKEKGRSVAWGDVDGDGKLDLAIANWGAPNKVYRNQGEKLEDDASWVSSDEGDFSRSVAWGDVDGDGDLDLAVGNSGDWDKKYLGQPNKLYLNEENGLNPSASWQSDDHKSSDSVTWGDLNGDGKLDLAVANMYDRNTVYLNLGQALSTQYSWSSEDSDHSSNVALADVDNDGDLDMTVTSRNGSNKIYKNNRKILSRHGESWAEAHITYDVAWGDMDNDGDLDLAVANTSPNLVYRNTNGKLEQVAIWSSKDNDGTYGAAWGDYDNDGYLDLAVANWQGHNRIYRNQNGMLNENPDWSSADNDKTTDVAWADYDGDGDLDLAVANWFGANKLYLNKGTTLDPNPLWVSEERDYSWSVAWGDIDNDGDLDLAVANASGPNKLYQNQDGQLERVASWKSNDTDYTFSVAWGDVDSDGDLDLAVVNNGSPNKVYLNHQGILSRDPFWVSNDSDFSSSIAWGDMDNDGDLDLAVGNRYDPNKVYLNQNGTLTSQAFWKSDDKDITRGIAWGDMDGDGDLDLASGNDGQKNKLYLSQRFTPSGSPAIALRSTTAAADFYAYSKIIDTGIIPITYTLFHPNSAPMQVRAFYSLNGGGKWLKANPPSETKSPDLDTSPSGVTHTYLWDVLSSGFFGQSDNVVFRLEAQASFKPITNTVPGPFQHPYVSAQTYPFRVRGSQVRVFSGTLPIPNALVYRLPTQQIRAGNVLGKSAQEPFRTDSEGYLEGRGELAIGDRLVALLPVSEGLLSFDGIELDSPLAEGYTLYYTSPVLTETALTAHTISQLGVQTVTVSADNPLLLFDLDVSLEWDASQNQSFMKQLEYDLRRTSELLYDWTNGQAALGKLTIYHASQNWDEADIHIYATNRLRPHANIGGIVSRTLSDPDNPTLEYQPGHVEIGSSWNRYGNRSGTLGEDWPRALAHELGHYLFFLGDNYLGFDESKHLISIEECRSAMSNPYRNDADYSEFLPQDKWSGDCLETLSHKASGRSDWATIQTFYPSLKAPSTINKGPNLLPLEVTQVSFQSSETASTTLALPIFYLIDESGGRVLFGSTARAYLLQNNQLIDLGQPTLDQVLARGARLGDKLCVFEGSRFGCEQITAGDDQLTIHEVPDWQPDVIVRAINNGLNVEVSNITITPEQSISARLYPINDLAPAAMTITTTSHLDRVSFTFDEQPEVGYVHVLVDDGNPNTPDLETITTYTVLHGSPIAIAGGGGTIAFAPMMSSDGQVLLYDHSEEEGKDKVESLQSISNMPAMPRWVDTVGPVYRMITSENDGDLFDMSITFNYLEQDVRPGEEPSLRIYYLTEAEQSKWEALTTTLDIEHNFASASIKGAGLYALMSGQPIKLKTGWNLFAYPLWTTQPITEALAPIEGKYEIVCGYDREDTQDPWKVYRVGRDAKENDLQQLEYGRGYWIKVTEPITFSLRGGNDQSRFTNSMIREAPPFSRDGCETIEETVITEPTPETPPTLDMIYIVQPDDTMYRIAKSHQTTVRAIIEANDLPNAYLQVGQRLIIPGRTGR